MASSAGTGNNQQGCEDVARVQALLREAGVSEYDTRVVNMVMDIAYQTAVEMLQSARAVSQHCGKTSIDATDVKIASEFHGFTKNEAPNREQILKIAANTNNQPLPQIRHNFGLKLPNDRFCVLQSNVQWRFDNPPIANIPSNVQQELAPHHQLRPEHVQNILKRKAPAGDDFD